MVRFVAFLVVSCTGVETDSASPDASGRPDDVGADDTESTDPGDDTGITEPGDDTADVEYTWACSAVGASDSDGFFALEAFDGQLYAGQFGYGREGQSMLYRYAPWELTSPGLTGISESVCAMLEWNGYLYANTESSGDLFRSADGANWSKLYDGEDGTIGCGLAAFGSHLYAINYDNQDKRNGKILRTADGTSWETVYDSGSAGWYIREIVSYDGALYAFAVDEGAGYQGWLLSSTDGANWSTETTPTRYFRGYVWNDYLWIGTSDYSSTGAAGVWRFDGSSSVQVHSEPRHYVTEMAEWRGALWAGTSGGWKDDEDPAALLRTEDGSTWDEVCDFAEVAVWSIAVAGDDLYVGTWDYEEGGAVYVVEAIPVVGDGGVDDVDCSLIPAANSAWELCEEGPDYCHGVYTDGAGCEAYCAAAGLSCTARYGGEPGCQKEAYYPIACGEVNGHESDWCECE